MVSEPSEEEKLPLPEELDALKCLEKVLRDHQEAAFSEEHAALFASELVRYEVAEKEVVLLEHALQSEFDECGLDLLAVLMQLWRAKGVGSRENPS